MKRGVFHVFLLLFFLLYFSQIEPYFLLMLWKISVPWQGRRYGCWRVQLAPVAGPGCQPRLSWVAAGAQSHPLTDDTSSGPSAYFPQRCGPLPSPESRSREGMTEQYGCVRTVNKPVNESVFIHGSFSHLSDTLHGTAYFMGHALKAVQVPAGDLSDNVV